MKKTLLALALTVATGGVMAEGIGFMPWTTWMKDIWSAYDMNKDGALSQDEVAQMQRTLGEDVVGFQPWYMDHYAELDANKDGVVEYRPVRLGVADGGRRVVEPGLAQVLATDVVVQRHGIGIRKRFHGEAVRRDRGCRGRIGRHCGG